ncbi:MAG: hypothetical protein RBS57_06870 [Desulforhabdus sp.]|jgi:DNA-binding response OmpR family regulator|nr:hypothetical protein [Desulforhabdus sp.]
MRGVIVASRKQSEESLSLGEVLAAARYRVLFNDSTATLWDEVEAGRYQAIILDLDTVPADDSFIKKLRGIHSALCIIFLSSRSFHPELKESFSNYVCACIKKPVNPEEVLFCLKNLCAAGKEDESWEHQQENLS